MKNYIKWSGGLFLACAMVLFSPSKSTAQDPEFTQFYANHLYLNPAFAGTHGCPRFNLNYRNQWPSLSGTFVTSSVSYDQYIKSISGGIGIMVTNDMSGQGTINHTTGSLIYSYHLALNRKWSMLFGAQATWNQKFLDWNKLTFGDQIDPRRGFIYQTGDVPRGGSRGFFDVSVGTMVYNKVFYAGFVAKHLNRPNESMIFGPDSNMPMRFTAHMGANIEFGQRSQYNNGTSLSPNIIWSYQNGFMQTNVGLYVKYGVFTTGVWYRDRDAFIVLVGLNTGKFRFGYSYDLTISRLTNASGGSHELSMGFNLSCREKPRQFRTISCPSF